MKHLASLCVSWLPCILLTISMHPSHLWILQWGSIYQNSSITYPSWNASWLRCFIWDRVKSWGGCESDCKRTCTYKCISPPHPWTTIIWKTQPGTSSKDEGKSSFGKVTVAPAPRLWNSLSRDAQLDPSLKAFWRHVMTKLFRQDFN